MTHTDDPKFDDDQNHEVEQDRDQLELDMLSEDAVKSDDTDDVVDLDTFFEDSAIDLDLPDESQMGENTATYADELDMFADLEQQELTNEGTIVPLGDLEFGTSHVVAPREFFDDQDNDHVDIDADLVGEIPVDAEEWSPAEETDHLFLGGKAVDKLSDQLEMPDNAVLPLPVEVLSIVKDKKAKKSKKDKALKVKKEKLPKVKKEKKPKEPHEKQPWTVIAMGIAAISILIGCMFLLANVVTNL